MLKENIERKIERVQKTQVLIKQNAKEVAKNLVEASEQVANGDFRYLDEVKNYYEWLQERIDDLNRYKDFEMVYKDILESNEEEK